jgi:MFS family permease
MGIDPWPWAIGGFGAAIVFFKKEKVKDSDVIVNSAISIAAGGLVAPLLAGVLAHYTSPELYQPYPLAFILSAVWPWAIPLLEAWRGHRQEKKELKRKKLLETAPGDLN